MRNFSNFVFSPYFHNLRSRQDSCTRAFLDGHVSAIIRPRPFEKMRGPNTARSVARMKRAHAFRQWSFGKNPCNTMRDCVFAARHVHVAVAVLVSIASPKPMTFRFPDLRPEPDSECLWLRTLLSAHYGHTKTLNQILHPVLRTPETVHDQID